MQLATAQFPDDPCLCGAEFQFAFVGFFTNIRIVFKYPFEFWRRDYEITRDADLAAALNKDSVDAFILKLKNFFRESVGSERLRRITIDGRNAVEENKIFDCLKLIASIYGKLVTECLERGYTEGEITIKIEEPGGIRTEKYLKKSEIYRELSTIGSEGKELAALLRVSDA